mgnify:CR=1 FL=1
MISLNTNGNLILKKRTDPNGNILFIFSRKLSPGYFIHPIWYRKLSTANMTLKDFEILARLGEGSYSSVWKVKRIIDGKEYAMKRVKLANLSEKDKWNALNEVRILASINSPFIIGYKEAFFDDDSMTLCIIMEFAAEGDIGRKIQLHQRRKTSFDESEIWAVFVQTLKGLKVLHSNKILHRDIKSANIFLTADNTAKLGDLNVSKVAKNNLAYTQAGTPYYASPEVWKDQPYDKKCDIWSLGCVIYEMAALRPPFRANDLEELKRKVMKGIFERIPAKYSNELNEIISLCLRTAPIVRPSCEQLLTHPIVLKNSRISELDPVEESQRLPLLSTIRVPKNLKVLSSQLPKPNYDGSFVEVAKALFHESPKENTVKGSLPLENLPLESMRPEDPTENITISARKRQEEYIEKENVNSNTYLPKVLESYKRAVPTTQNASNMRTRNGGPVSNPMNNRNNMLPTPREESRFPLGSCDNSNLTHKNFSLT